LEATALDFGVAGSLGWRPSGTGVFELLQSLWPQSRSGPSSAHYLLLAAIHRVCQPVTENPKSRLVCDRPSCVRSGLCARAVYLAEFWDCFDRIPEENWNKRRSGLLGLWKEKQLVSRRILAYDTTTSIPTWPAPMSATIWHSADITSKVS